MFDEECFEDTFIRIKGYDNRVYAQWEHTRLIIYTIAMTVTAEKDRVEIYDFMPLKNDPTAEERLQKVKDFMEDAAARQREFNEQLRMEMKKEGG